MNDIAERIKYIRKDFNLNQVEFAKMLGVTNAHISRMEKGITVPSEALSKLICKEFDVNEEWLKTGKTPIYIDKVHTDEIMCAATSNLNKILKNDNELLRTLTAESFMIFSEIIRCDGIDSEIQKIYLSNIIDLLKVIDQFTSEIKNDISNGQLVIEFAREGMISSYSRRIEKQISEISKILLLFGRTME